MERFEDYFYTKENKDVEETISKLPKNHQKLVSDYEIIFEPNNTLYKDKKYIGTLTDKKLIIVAAPWRYGREFTFLHEIGHIVYQKYLENNEQLLKKWTTIVNNTKNKGKKESVEEYFCHAYANQYATVKIVAYDHDSWQKFIRELN